MELIVGVEIDLTIGNVYQHEVEIFLLIMWDHFLESLLVSYCRAKKEDVKIELYISQDKGGRRRLAEYVIPINVIDFYGRAEFKTVLPKGSMVDLFEQAFKNRG